MLRKIKKVVTAEGARRDLLEGQLKEWLHQQLLIPAPGRPRNVVLGKGTLFQRTRHINPCAVTLQGVEYIDLEVRNEQGGKVVVTMRIRANNGEHTATLWH